MSLAEVNSSVNELARLLIEDGTLGTRDGEEDTLRDAELDQRWLDTVEQLGAVHILRMYLDCGVFSSVWGSCDPEYVIKVCAGYKFTGDIYQDGCLEYYSRILSKQSRTGLTVYPHVPKCIPKIHRLVIGPTWYIAVLDKLLATDLPFGEERDLRLKHKREISEYLEIPQYNVCDLYGTNIMQDKHGELIATDPLGHSQAEERDEVRRRVARVAEVIDA